MRRAVDRDEIVATWLILVGCWIILLYPVAFTPTAQTRGAHVLAFGGTSLCFVVLGWRWGLGSLEWNEWLLLPTAVALGLTLDAGGGVVMNYAALAMLATPFLRHLARRR